MKHKKAIIIGSSVLVGATAILLLVRRKRNTTSPQETPQLPTESPESQIPWDMIKNDLKRWWKKRKSENTTTSTDSTTPSLPNVEQPSFLKRGSKGSKVVALQKWLNQSAGANLTVDGDFGAATELAVKREQDPFATYLTMYPDAEYGRISKTFYDLFIKSFE